MKIYGGFMELYACNCDICTNFDCGGKEFGAHGFKDLSRV